MIYFTQIVFAILALTGFLVMASKSVMYSLLRRCLNLMWWHLKSEEYLLLDGWIQVIFIFSLLFLQIAYRRHVLLFKLEIKVDIHMHRKMLERKFIKY